MRVWLIQVGEPLPINDHPRLLRTGFTAKLLAKKGHEVVWWASAFDHFKRKIVSTEKQIALQENLKIKLLPSIGYNKRISFRRLLDHYLLARAFAKQISSEPPPDIILASMPSIELCYEAAKYAQKLNIPIVLDLRDMWPDIFVDRAPSFLKPFVKLASYPLASKLRYACYHATALFGITDKFVAWGASYAGRERGALDKTFHLAYSETKPPINSLKEAEQFWKKYGLNDKSEYFVLSFVGTFRPQVDLAPIIQAAKLLRGKFKIVLGGQGDGLEYYKKLANNHPGIIFPGWLNATQIWALLRLSSVGFAPYCNTMDFMASIPNKPIEYFSAGLPIVSSLKGELEKLLSCYSCGITYDRENVQALAQILQNLMEKREQLNIMSNNAYDLYKKKFVAENVYAEMINCLEEMHRSYDIG